MLTPDTRVKVWRRPVARVATLTAIKVLQTTGSPEARTALRDWLRSFSVLHRPDPVLAAHAHRALRGLDGGPEPADRRKRMDQLVDAALNTPTKEEREKALKQLAEDAYVEAIPAMRLSFAGDISGDVREQAAYALARVGDIDSVERLVRMLRSRAADPGQAKVAGYALGMLGDLRGVQTKSWTTLASMPQSAAGAGSAKLGTILYCFGGSDTGVLGSGTAYDYVQIYQK